MCKIGLGALRDVSHMLKLFQMSPLCTAAFGEEEHGSFQGSYLTTSSRTVVGGGPHSEPKSKRNPKHYYFSACTEEIRRQLLRSASAGA